MMNLDEHGVDLGEVNQAAVDHYLSTSTGATESQIRVVLVKLTQMRASYQTTMWQGEKISMATWDAIIDALRARLNEMEG